VSLVLGYTLGAEADGAIEAVESGFDQGMGGAGKAGLLVFAVDERNQLDVLL
jgi:hypothetical protein